MALRIKSQWFKSETARGPAQTASVMSFIIWRVTQAMVKNMRDAGFDIDVGPSYFAFMREVLVFLAQVVDRVAYARMDAQARSEFTSAMVVRLAEILEESADEWLGKPAADQQRHSHQFIDLYNDLSPHYAEFNYGADGPDFGFMRYLGSRIEAVMPDKDKRWVIDQIMAIEVPDALELVQRGLDGALNPEPRRRQRSSVQGD